MTNSTSQELFIHDVDAGMRESIIRLDQKLRGLRAEIEFKMQTATQSSAPKDGYQSRLPALLEEIDLAIQGIEQLVNMVVPEDEALKHSFFESEDMRLFKEAIEEHLKQLTALKNEL